MDNGQNVFFTVFTSTYNRKHTINRVWESLINQTYKNFEWIIIDNGSEDNIQPLLEEFKLKADFNVRIFFQENLGKYRAFNRVLDLAEGELLIPADSDDSFEFNTLERFNEIWKEYKAEDISGITVLCKYADGSLVGKKFPVEGISNYEDMVYKYKLDSENWGCVRVDVLKKYRFPTDFDVKYFPDLYIWAQIGFNYKTVYINDALRIYHQDSGNQVTNEKERPLEYFRMKNFFTLWKINYIFSRTEKYLSFKEYIQTFVFLWLTAFKSGISASQIIKNIERANSKIAALLLLFPSWFIFKSGLRLKYLRKKKYKYQQSIPITKF